MCSYRNQTPNPQTTIACISETKSTCISFSFMSSLVSFLQDRMVLLIVGNLVNWSL